jgi:hypothetical protein
LLAYTGAFEGSNSKSNGSDGCAHDAVNIRAHEKTQLGGTDRLPDRDTYRQRNGEAHPKLHIFTDIVAFFIFADVNAHK